MERILRQRDKLLAISARLIGLASTTIAFVLLAMPGVTTTGRLLLTLPFFVALAAVQYRMGTTKALVWPLLVVAIGLALIVMLRLEVAGAFDGIAGAPSALHGVALTHPSAIPAGTADAIRTLAAGSVGAASILLTINLGRMLVLVGAFVATMITVTAVFTNDPAQAYTTLTTIAGWGAQVAAGSVLSAALLQASRRISNIGRAHRIERQASETEAQRRQGARLLHDTVLATLTLLAHSGVGVSTEALRQQAREDAQLLRQLRLSSASLSPGVDDVPDPDHPAPPSALEAVKTRFARLGLDVSWHGAGSVSLPAAKQDAFLLALAECLENVRRHSGVSEAHVTITDDEKTVRGLVTDNGGGFDPADVEAGKLGYEESIVGRLREVGGNARVFSAAGSGTTVVLEVPR